MSSEIKRIEITKENIDQYLKEVGKEYRKLGGKECPAEMVLIGGASVLINYGFRGMTTDIDALIHAASSMKDAINRVGDKYDLPNGWLNSDFTKTSSFTPRLFQYSSYYKTFSNVLTIRTISAEYLIAMKLRSGRKYKNDLSDILGILTAHKLQGSPITMDAVQNAVQQLYGNWDALPEYSQRFIENVMENGRYEELYCEYKTDEQSLKDDLITFEHRYPGVTNESNVDEIIRKLHEKNKPSIMERLNKETHSSEHTFKTEKNKRKKSDLEL